MPTIARRLSPRVRGRPHAPTPMILAALLLGGIVNAACGGGAPKAAADGEARSASEAEPSIADPIIRAYLDVQGDLARDDISSLPKRAGQLVLALEKTADQPGAEDMLAAAGRVGARDIDTARVAFRRLSAGLLTYLAARPAAREGLVAIHCPMTFGGEGATWVQRVGPVMNPYEGSMMLHCGNRLGWDEAGPAPGDDATTR